MMVSYEQDPDAIMVEPTKTKKGTDLMRLYKVIQKTLKYRGLNLKTHILENECSHTL